ncbi:unnamed protein product [marine sediment metagenome]|uniref:Uncharacterized protein n=1 Tax=marine sediment metagenome TaxID=412755 RepID=X0T5J3_9ZZZZ
MDSNYFKFERNPDYEESERKNMLTYCLLGDPEVDIYTKIPIEVVNPFLESIYEGQLVSILIKDFYLNIRT